MTKGLDKDIEEILNKNITIEGMMDNEAIKIGLKIRDSVALQTYKDQLADTLQEELVGGYDHKTLDAVISIIREER